MPREDFLARARGVSGILCTLADRVDAELMDAAGPSLAVVSNFAVGVNNVDVAEATRRGIRICNTPDVLTDATADLGFTLLLSAARKVSDADRFVRAGEWTGWDPWGFLGVPVAGKTLGIVGMGKIGAALARRSRGFSMKVLYSNRRRIPPSEEAGLGASYRDLDALLAESDFVSLHTPLTKETENLLSVERIARMKPGAVVVNTARGAVVDDAALAEALRSGQISAAGLDVFRDEPHVPEVYVGLENVVLTPHIGSGTRETRAAMARLVIEDVLRVARGEPPRHPVP
jgi:glyoxylate reductase